MIRKINIKTKNNIYSILIENKSIIKNLNKIINNLKNNKLDCKINLKKYKKISIKNWINWLDEF